MVLSRDASTGHRKYLARENSEERIKTDLDRLTTQEDEDQKKDMAKGPLLIKPAGNNNNNSNLDILPFTDFGNKSVWEATEGRGMPFQFTSAGTNHANHHYKYK